MRVFKHLGVWGRSGLSPFTLWEFHGIWERLMLLCKEREPLSAAAMALLPMFDTERNPDTNHDGKVDQGEWEAAGGSAQEFGKADLNADGAIDPYEMKMRALAHGGLTHPEGSQQSSYVCCTLANLAQYSDGHTSLHQEEEFRYFGTTVWPGCTRMRVCLYQRSGKAGLELYVRHAEVPSHDDWEKRAMEPANHSRGAMYECILTDPAEGVYYIGVGGVLIYTWELEVELDGQREEYRAPELLSG